MSSVAKPYIAEPVLEVDGAVRYELGGEIGRRLGAILEQSVLPMPQANPGMLEMFSDRDREPLRQMVPWAGEFAGKYLTHAVAILRLTRDARLEAQLRWFVEELLARQDADGYLGPWPRAHRLGANNPPPNTGTTWDAWGHYHCMYGLLQWHAHSGDAAALDGARKIGDLFCATFLGTGRRFHDMDAHEMNMAPYHSLWLLYRETGDERYRAMADEIEKDLEKPPAGDYVRTALQGLEFWQTPKPRWESLHALQGLAEKHFLTGDTQYRRAFEHLWWSMLKGDRHNNGGFTSGEKACGDPCDLGAIETCCTVAWTAMSVDMLRLSGLSIVADELELTLFNSGLGLMAPSGRWVTYDTPMEGRRFASQHSIVFQARPGTEELNCCSVNGPRVLGLLADWALMRRGDGLVLNYYGPATLKFALASGSRGRLEQETDYPLGPRAIIRVRLDAPESFVLDLRIPHWSTDTRVTVAGEPVAAVKPGAYLRVNRQWQDGDAVAIEFDFRPRYWVQEGAGHFYRDWETAWGVFGPVYPAGSEPPRAVLERVAELPHGLQVAGQTLAANVMRSVGGKLDFLKLPRPFEPATAVFCFTEVESERAASVPVRFCAGYEAIIAVNGKVVFDGAAAGYDGDVSLRRWRADLPLRRGKNLIGVAVLRFPPRTGAAGHYEWILSIGIGAPVSSPETGQPRARYQLASIYRGPILLAFDPCFGDGDVERMPGFDARTLRERVVAPGRWPQPWLLLECADAEGRPLRLCDFASAGVSGAPYRTWFNVRGVQPAEFKPTNPSRSVKPAG